MSDGIEQARELIAAADTIVALTGAGVSTPSGIPDFRSAGSGLWSRYDPMEVASISGFRSAPDRFFDWMRPLARKTRDARPNPAHTALADLQKSGRLGPIITQNIDGLHEAAGATDVLALHGHSRSATCLDCGTGHGIEVVEEALEREELPACSDCSSNLVKPDVILFGEYLPEEIFERAQSACAAANLMIIAGSSLEVYPANNLPGLVVQNGGKLLIVNIGATRHDDAAACKIEGAVEEILPRLI